jgi:Peptidase family M20/M25/M40
MGEAAIAKLAKKWLTASGIKSWLEDMKGSAAAVMSAASALVGSDFPGRVLIALVADEEYASLGAQDFVRRHNADACILTEPSEGRLVLAHKGFVWAGHCNDRQDSSRQPLGFGS